MNYERLSLELSEGTDSDVLRVAKLANKEMRKRNLVLQEEPSSEDLARRTREYQDSNSDPDDTD